MRLVALTKGEVIASLINFMSFFVAIPVHVLIYGCAMSAIFAVYRLCHMASRLTTSHCSGTCCHSIYFAVKGLEILAVLALIKPFANFINMPFTFFVFTNIHLSILSQWQKPLN
jgi:hypothetical protein